MKILFYTDVHLCESESLVRARGLEYTARIENCVESVNWAEQLADQQQCDLIICGGDFFDKAKISAEEVTATVNAQLPEAEKLATEAEELSKEVSTLQEALAKYKV